MAIAAFAPAYESFAVLLVAGAVFLAALFIYNHVKKDKE